MTMPSYLIQAICNTKHTFSQKKSHSLYAFNKRLHHHRCPDLEKLLERLTMTMVLGKSFIESSDRTSSRASPRIDCIAQLEISSVCPASISPVESKFDKD